MLQCVMHWLSWGKVREIFKRYQFLLNPDTQKWLSLKGSNVTMCDALALLERSAAVMCRVPSSGLPRSTATTAVALSAAGTVPASISFRVHTENPTPENLRAQALRGTPRGWKSALPQLKTHCAPNHARPSCRSTSRGWKSHQIPISVAPNPLRCQISDFRFHTGLLLHHFCITCGTICRTLSAQEGCQDTPLANENIVPH